MLAARISLGAALAVLVLPLGDKLIHAGWSFGFWRIWFAVVVFAGGSCLVAFGSALFARRPFRQRIEIVLLSIPAVLVVAGASLVTYAVFHVNG